MAAREKTVVPQTDYRNFPYSGFLVKRELNKRLELAAEVFFAWQGGRRNAADAVLHSDRRRRLLHFKKHAERTISLLLMAIPLPDKPRTTPTSACTGRGARATRSRRQPAFGSIALTYR